MMDALPITLGQEFGAFAQAIARDRWRIYKVEERLRQINLGGTAIGTGSNANRLYTFRVIEIIRDLTGIGQNHLVRFTLLICKLVVLLCQEK